METPINIIIAENKVKFEKTVNLIIDSLQDLSPYDPTIAYTSNGLIPYDALAMRFERAVGMGIKLFKSIELQEFGTLDNSLRDMFNNMHKLNLISNATIWMEMRGARNRVADDYLEVMLDRIYQDVARPYPKSQNPSQAG